MPVDARGGLGAGADRLDRLDAVVFVDFDQELVAPRYRAGEEALALIVRIRETYGTIEEDEIIAQDTET